MLIVSLNMEVLGLNLASHPQIESQTDVNYQRLRIQLNPTTK